MDAGCLIEPPVSVPVAAGTIPDATAAADPPDEPPGIALGSQGLKHLPKAQFNINSGNVHAYRSFGRSSANSI